MSGVKAGQSVHKYEFLKKSAVFQKILPCKCFCLLFSSNIGGKIRGIYKNTDLQDRRAV